MLELGCGLMMLEKYLSTSARYVPCDVVARDDRTTVCNLKLTAPPAVAGSAVAALGQHEYVHEPARLMAILACSYGVCIFSHCMTDASNPIEPHLTRVWVNNFSKGQIEELFQQSGWDKEPSEHHHGVQGIWRLRSRHKE